jgi:hypothetical protein
MRHRSGSCRYKALRDRGRLGEQRGCVDVSACAGGCDVGMQLLGISRCCYSRMMLFAAARGTLVEG